MNKIDLSCIVGSQVLCEFFGDDGESHRYGFLKGGSLSGDFHDEKSFVWQYCRIYQHKHYWISNADGKLVLPDGLIVNVIAEGDEVNDCIVSKDGFAIGEPDMDADEGLVGFERNIAECEAVQVTGVADGWEW